MNRYLLYFLIIFFINNSNAQNYQISFDASGASSIIDSVKVENLTQCISIYLQGSDILNLNGNAGIDDYGNNKNNSLHISPNPMTDCCLIDFETYTTGETAIEIFDMSGRRITGINTFLSAGLHKFRLSGIGSGIFYIKIYARAFSLNSRIISCSLSQEICELKHIETAPANDNNVNTSLKENKKVLKDGKFLVNMQYAPGDILKLTGIAGKFRTVFMLIPNNSQAVTFNFIECTDVNKNNYAIVKIGTQIWMAENLNVGIRINGDIEQTYNNRPIEKYCYSDDENNCKIYGGLYEWGEMMQYDSTGKAQGICPKSWHIPSDSEMTVLTDYLGGLDIASGRMKEACTSLWFSPNAGATNESGLSLLPGGMRYAAPSIKPRFQDKGRYWDFWTSTADGDESAWYRDIGFSDTKVHRASYYKTCGFSARCVKD
jgi:uncharacterized protein (TIGR02145 family)